MAKRIINFRCKDYDYLVNPKVVEVVTEPIVVNNQFVYQCKTVTKNPHDFLRDLKVSDFAMSNALVSGIAADFKPMTLTDNNIDGLIDNISGLESRIDSLTETNGEG